MDFIVTLIVHMQGNQLVPYPDGLHIHSKDTLNMCMKKFDAKIC